MKGDFSRGTFDPQKHYAGVLMQQGRVQLDADWNEQLAIAAHHSTVEARDVIGQCGAPLHAAGFGITVQGQDLVISGGRYYVDGILCENEANVLFREQPDLPNPPDWLEQLTKAQTTFGIVYLDVWQRHITALDDSHLREVALGGPDTTTRVKTLWQVKVLPVQTAQFTVDEFLAFLTDFATVIQDAARAAQSRELQGRLAARARRVSDVVAQPSKFTERLETDPDEIKNELHDFLGEMTPLARQADNAKLNAALKQFADFIDLLGTATVITCDSSFQEWDNLIAPSTATLKAHTVLTPASSDPCIIPPSAGYRSLENQLYRVEIHNGSEASGGATFKWSRDNGSVVTTIEKINGQEITVHDTGPDDVLGFTSGQWVEITDDALELNGLPGQLAQIQGVNTTTRIITLTTPAIPLATNGDGVDKIRHPKLRRWDQPTNTPATGVPVTTSSLALEHGIEVEFSGGNLKTGDYWLIPARTATAEIEWPPFAVPNTNPSVQPPLGIQHHFCRLALVQLDDQKKSGTVTDCRNLFPSLTEITAPTATALHVTATNWVNDDLFAIATLQNDGLRITLDAPPDPNSINNNSVVVTVEMPFNPPLSERFLQNVIIPCTVTSDPQKPNVILCQFNIPLAPLKLNPQSTMRVMLKGHIIWRNEQRAQPVMRKYLDGQAFGGPGLRADKNTPRTALTFPTGAGAPASDFESWFFVDTQTPAHVIRIEPPDGAQFDTGEGNLPRPPEFIRIFFDKSLQRATVNADTVRIVRAIDGEPALPWPGTVTYEDATRSVLFTPQQPFGTRPSVLRLFTLTVFGDTPNRILDVDGLALDGDGNGSPGGNFTSKFTVTHIIV